MASINTNIAAYYAQNNLRTASNNAQSSIARLSSGNAIVQASDDVSGLAIGTILQTDVSTLQTATSNASQATSLLQVANGALTSLTDILQRQSALATQSNSGTLSDTERGYLNQEFAQLTTEYNQIVGDTNFNGVNLLDGTIAASGGLNGAATATAQTMTGLPTTGNTIATAAFSNSYNTKVAGSQSGAIVSITMGTAGTKDIVTAILNGQTYTSAAAGLDLSTAGAHSIALTDNAGDILTLTTVATATGGTTQATANTLAASLQSDLSGTSVYQTRAVSSTANVSTGIPATAFDGTVFQGGSGASFVLKSDGFGNNGTSAPTISGWNVQAYNSTTSTNGAISVNINGDTYTAALTSATLATGALTLTDANDPNSTLTVTVPASVNVGSDAGASSLATALNNAFSTGTAGGLNFQVGTNSDDAINVSLQNLDSVAVGVNGLDISTVAGAQTASNAITSAINTVTSATANVGALEERFNYATNTLSTSIQNLDAARGDFLDTDVSSESTKFATEQVLQQAAISVLAQANQIPQNLLKLLS